MEILEKRLSPENTIICTVKTGILPSMDSVIECHDRYLEVISLISNYVNFISSYKGADLNEKKAALSSNILSQVKDLEWLDSNPKRAQNIVDSIMIAIKKFSQRDDFEEIEVWENIKMITSKAAEIAETRRNRREAVRKICEKGVDFEIFAKGLSLTDISIKLYRNKNEDLELFINESLLEVKLAILKLLDTDKALGFYNFLLENITKISLDFPAKKYEMLCESVLDSLERIKESDLYKIAHERCEGCRFILKEAARLRDNMIKIDEKSRELLEEVKREDASTSIIKSARVLVDTIKNSIPTERYIGSSAEDLLNDLDSGAFGSTAESYYSIDDVYKINPDGCKKLLTKWSQTEFIKGTNYLGVVSTEKAELYHVKNSSFFTKSRKLTSKIEGMNGRVIKNVELARRGKFTAEDGKIGVITSLILGEFYTFPV